MKLMSEIKWPIVVAAAALAYWLSILPTAAHANNGGQNKSLIGTLSPSQISGAADGVFLCEEAIAIAEKNMGIPRKLLHAIALGESGRGLPDHIQQSDQSIDGMTLWPWTVMAEGKGRYFESKFEATKEVTKLKHKKIRNIDVGCMQVNLYYHGKAFTDLNQAFDPIHNVAYAASFLKQLRMRHKSWTKAVKYYHSGNPDKHNKYAKKILSLWRKLQLATKKTKTPKQQATMPQVTKQVSLKAKAGSLPQTSFLPIQQQQSPFLKVKAQ